MTVPFPILLFARGAIVLALALLATRLLRRAPASLRYAVLGSALAAVLALPAIEAFAPAWHAGAIPADVPEVVEPPALPVAEAAVPAIAPAFSAGRPPATPSPVPWRAIAGALWAAGIATVLLRAAGGALRARRIAGRGTPARGVDAYVAEAWRALGGRGAPPSVVVSDEIEAPIVVGAIAPAVVVPYASSVWTAERWRVVLLHELAHVRRRDGIGNLVAQLACGLHWIDPLAWIAARRLREERELAVDDAVLRTGRARRPTRSTSSRSRPRRRTTRRHRRWRSPTRRGSRRASWRCSTPIARAAPPARGGRSPSPERWGWSRRSRRAPRRRAPPRARRRSRPRARRSRRRIRRSSRRPRRSWSVR